MKPAQLKQCRVADSSLPFTGYQFSVRRPCGTYSRNCFALYSVPQRELHGVGVEIKLSLQVRLIVYAHVVVYHRDGNNEGDVAVSVCFYDLEHLDLFSRT